MKAIMVMFDSLNRHMLPPYGYSDIVAPNFERLASHCVTFDNCYAGSMPCMPARRELHTGRYNFLHRSWGPLEPYDDSMPRTLTQNGIYTHLTTDHWHYWEEGGCNYWNQYNTYEFVRGQEGDPWKGRIRFEQPEHIDGRQDACGKQEFINRYYMREEKDQSIAVNFQNGLDFITNNHEEDNWFLTIESFDPHEPFFSPQSYKDYYDDGYDGIMFDWPGYHKVRETKEQIQHCINEYKAIVTMCDRYLGKVLDMMDEYNMWEDTMLIVNTDHGFLLDQHGWWGKVMMPYYNELVHIPLFIWNPKVGKAGEHRQALVQTIDIAPTLLEYFGMDIPKDMLGKPLEETLRSDKKVRDYALFGQHGVHVNITDGRYVYMRCPLPGHEDELYNYVLEPTSYPGGIREEELQSVQLHPGFSFTKGCPVLKMKGGYGIKSLGFPPKTITDCGTLLYDLESDPKQEHPIQDKETEDRMIHAMVRLMKENDAPAEQYSRLGLPVD